LGSHKKKYRPIGNLTLLKKWITWVVVSLATTATAKLITDTNDLTAQSWLVADADNRILASKDTTTVRSIGSITKIMTVLAVMESRPLMDQHLTYNKKLRLTRQELIEITLVRSDNHAADVLCNNYLGGYKKCIEAMNDLAIKDGLENTRFADASGLSSGNVSTAEDLLKLLTIAEKNYLIVGAAGKTKVTIKNKKKWLVFKQTNPLIGHKHKFIVSKTGTTNAAGGCIVLTVETERGLRRVVVLGSKDGRTRIPEAEFIYNTN
jgi:D-alanyl-D-alanine endopeptidase (penicillin-binding protein 7)